MLLMMRILTIYVLTMIMIICTGDDNECDYDEHDYEYADDEDDQNIENYNDTAHIDNMHTSAVV